MTVAELIAKLLTFDGGMDIYVKDIDFTAFIGPEDVQIEDGDVVIYI